MPVTKKLRDLNSNALTSEFRWIQIQSMNTLLNAKKQPRRTALPAPQDWHKADIKAALEKAGWSLRQLSLSHGKSAGYYREVLHRPNPSAEAALAEILKATPQQIWPSRYEPSGEARRGLYKGTDNGRRYKDLPTPSSVGVSNGCVTAKTSSQD